MAASTIRKVIPINTCQHNVVYSEKDVIYQIICSITIVFNAFRTDRDDDTPNSRLPWLSSEAASGGGGLLLVFTAQNRHPRVQVSPRSMIVAVATPSPSPPAPPPPFQH
jgi:hypothetical protein